jgi:hypothetical protein
MIILNVLNSKSNLRSKTQFDDLKTSSSSLQTSNVHETPSTLKMAARLGLPIEGVGIAELVPRPRILMAATFKKMPCQFALPVCTPIVGL